MPAIPVYCPTCGAEGMLDGVITGSGAIRGMTFTNCTVDCPRCGHTARIIDGTYSLLGETMIALTNSPDAQARLSRIASTLAKVEKGNASPEAVIREVVQQAPEVKPLVDQLAENKVAAIALLVSLVGLLLDHGALIPWGDMARAIEEIIRQAGM